MTHKIANPGVASGMDTRLTASKFQTVWIRICFFPLSARFLFSSCIGYLLTLWGTDCYQLWMVSSSLSHLYRKATFSQFFPSEVPDLRIIGPIWLTCPCPEPITAARREDCLSCPGFGHAHPRISRMWAAPPA